MLSRILGTMTVLVVCLVTGCGGDKNPAVKEIAVIPKGTTHDFWKSIHAGAIKAEREEKGIKVVFRGPEREDDRASQIALIENFIASGIAAIVVTPLDDQALLAPVRLASSRGIPVVVADSGLKGEVGKDFVSFIATDNRKGGRLAGAHLSSLLNGEGRVLMLRYQEGSASTIEREAGFLEAMKEHPKIEVIDPKQYAGPTRETAQVASENLLDAHPGIQGIFCSNESATFGMLLALRSRQLIGKVKFMGFDASPGLVSALEGREIDGLIVQDPVKMGYLSVKAAAAALRGEKVEPLVDTGVALVTRESMNSAEHAALLRPDLDSYLGSK